MLVGLIVSLLAAFAWGESSGDRLLGTPAQPWRNQQWINSPVLSLSELKGKVVLLRFFMESSCPYCRGSAPYLNEFYRTYKGAGFVVIGMYTPKPAPEFTSRSVVEQYVKDYGFEFPVALDNDWTTLKSYWLDRVPDADFTSVSFLIDQKGIVSYIHPGGMYSKKDAEVIKTKIEELLKAPRT